MMRTLYFFLLCLSIAFTSTAQSSEKFTISGYIEDVNSGEKLISANLFDYKSEKGTITNTYGFYSLTLPKDSIYLTYSYIGYQDQQMVFFLDRDTTIHIRLSADLVLNEVEVVAEKYKRIEEQSQMSTV
ncbi:MAG: carboxypeptidase-like regulatory domain-containing protein, partial [Bacteroidota bacterium]